MKTIRTSLVALFLLSCASQSWAPQHSHEDSVFSQKVSNYSELNTELDSFKGEAMNIQTGETVLLGNFPSEIGGYRNEPFFKRTLLQDCKKWTGGKCVITRFMDDIYFESHQDVKLADKSTLQFKVHTLWNYETPEKQSGVSKLTENLGGFLNQSLEVAAEIAPTAYCARVKGNYRNAKNRKKQAEREERSWRNRANTVRVYGSGNDRQKLVNEKNRYWRLANNAQNRARTAQLEMDRYKRDYRNWSSNSLNKNSESCFELSGLLD